jgi:hypothetical protein
MDINNNNIHSAYWSLGPIYDGINFDEMQHRRARNLKRGNIDVNYPIYSVAALRWDQVALEDMRSPAAQKSVQLEPTISISISLFSIIINPSPSFAMQYICTLYIFGVSAGHDP